MLSSKPISLAQNGEILQKALNKARISIDILLEELREAKVIDVKNVALSIYEAEPFDFPRTIIKEGIVNLKELKQIQKDKDWVVFNLESLYQTDIKTFCLPLLKRKILYKFFI
jgi:uncharacterized membrane protein YcaP (DUF421 family)